MKRALIIGAGPSGLIAAGFAAKRGIDVTLIEKNQRPARKLMKTGKGRCNLTNLSDTQELISSVPRNGRFLYSAFTQFSPKDLMDFFEKEGVALKVERGKRVFPVSDRAQDVVDALVNFVRKSGAKFEKGRVTKLLIDGGKIVGAVTDTGQQYHAEAVLVCTGGVSYPGTGSTGDGYELARQVGHTVTELKPSLVPLTSPDSFCKDLMGLSLKNIAITVLDIEKNKPVYQDFGELLFTHFGLSGPVILSASAHMREMAPYKYRVVIDLKPALTLEQLDKRVQRDFIKYSNYNFHNSLKDLLPKSLIPVVVRLSEINEDIKVNQISKEQRLKLCKLLKGLKVNISGFRPIEEAIITSGGVEVSEIDPKTMESKLVKGLYFAGEILDVDAYTGGFNLQIAFSTGYLAGNSM